MVRADLAMTLAVGTGRRAEVGGMVHACVAMLMVLTALAGSGCAREDRPVVYCSVDETFARQVLKSYEEKTGVQVDAVFDTEAGKTTGLIRKIRAEAEHPRADVFFSGEVFQTIRLAGEGLLAEYEPPNTADVPARFKDPAHRWTGIGLRARVLAFDGNQITEDALPSQWQELAQPQYAKQFAFSNPLFGSGLAHVSAMFALWGPERGRGFLTGLRDGGARMVDGNSVAVREILDGQVTLAMTDTDDVRVARKSAEEDRKAGREGVRLEQRFLDMGDGGTLLFPSTVAVIKGCPHPDAARKLADFLVSAEVERMLAESESGNIPVRESLRRELHMELPPSTRLTYDAIADAMEPAAAAVREILIR